jgi:6-pyruvoyltetrahydropterin/6-carboxytetrahydropterin synthase
MYKIRKRWSFDAAHQLTGLPEGHKCGRLHGHTYTVEIELTAETLDDHGFVVDYGDLAPIKQLIDGVFDHKYLNDVFIGVNPTAESLASIICGLVISIYNTRRKLAPGDDPRDVAIKIGQNAEVTLHGVKPLREAVILSAVRVSETGSSWAEVSL